MSIFSQSSCAVMDSKRNMPTDAERFVEGGFRVLFERAADSGDRARREAARGVSPEQAFEDGRMSPSRRSPESSGRSPRLSPPPRRNLSAVRS